jgi:Cof subfamily protein (haloacid dehalogenase superfamily)
VIRRAYDALLLDLDGTLLDESGRVRVRNRDALRAAAERGVRVVLVTGRSEAGTQPILEHLGLDGPAVVFNGAAVWCPASSRFLEERLLADEVVARCLEHALDAGLYPVTMRRGEKLAPEPPDEELRRAVIHLEGLRFVPVDEIPTATTMRVTFLSRSHAASAELEREILTLLGRPVYTTHFPLNALPLHRESGLQVVDVQPPCRGKAEALRWLRETYDIPAERVVAVGDASNDLPMLYAAGLGVVMEGAILGAKDGADRVIGSNESDAIADLVEELFP